MSNKDKLKNLKNPSVDEIKDSARTPDEKILDKNYQKVEKEVVKERQKMAQGFRSFFGINDIFALRHMVKTLFTLLLFSGLVNMCLGGAIFMMMPLKEIDTRFIYVENEDGVRVGQVIKPYELTNSIRKSLAKHFIGDSVKRFAEMGIKREELKNFQVLRTRATPKALVKMKELRDKFKTENPGVTRQVEITGTKQMDRSTIRVFFTAYDENKNFEQASYELAADVIFYLHHEVAGAETRLYEEEHLTQLNPLGIQIVDINLLKGSFND